jgi:transposase
MFEIIRPDCAGIDLGSEAHFVSAREYVRRFGCFTADLYSLADWLKELGIEDVAMEATGVLWMPVYELLASRGFKVALVDGRAAKALPGRKSDVKDCQWVRDLHSCGLLCPCLVPEAEILVLRNYWRQRQRHIEQCSEQVQLMQKAMEQMNIQLHRVLSDISGVSGMRMVRAILQGVRDPSTLADMAHPRVKADRKKIEASLQGNWTEHHLFALKQAVQLFDFLQGCVAECDQCIATQMERLGGHECSPR